MVGMVGTGNGGEGWSRVGHGGNGGSCCGWQSTAGKGGVVGGQCQWWEWWEMVGKGESWVAV